MKNVQTCVSTGLVFVGPGCDLLRSPVSWYHAERVLCIGSAGTRAFKNPIQRISTGSTALTVGKHAVLRHPVHSQCGQPISRTLSRLGDESLTPTMQQLPISTLICLGESPACSLTSQLGTQGKWSLRVFVSAPNPNRACVTQHQVFSAHLCCNVHQNFLLQAGRHAIVYVPVFCCLSPISGPWVTSWLWYTVLL